MFNIINAFKYRCSVGTTTIGDTVAVHVPVIVFYNMQLVYYSRHTLNPSSQFFAVFYSCRDLISFSYRVIILNSMGCSAHDERVEKMSIAPRPRSIFKTTRFIHVPPKDFLVYSVSHIYGRRSSSSFVMVSRSD